jgi:hypothetical protein
MAVTPGYAGGLNPVFSPRRKVRKGVWGKKNKNTKFLAFLAPLREKKKYNLAEAQSTQRFLG